MLYSNDEMVQNETIFELESTQLKFGRNSLNELGWELSKYNSAKILLVLDPVLHDFNVTQKILDQIKASGTEVIIFDNICSFFQADFVKIHLINAINIA